MNSNDSRLPEALSPPVLVTSGGALRRVGIEFEFLGPSARGAAGAIARDLGGSIEAEDPNAFRIRNTRLGDLAVETDLRYLHPERHPGLGIRLGAGAARWLGAALSPVVPRELITGPMPIARLPEVDEIVGVLRGAGARGHGTVLWDSLSLHFNIDPPSLDAATLTAFLKAFLLTGDRIRQEVSQGKWWLAHVLPQDYPPAYRQLVLDPDYWPDLKTLADDYLAANPTRRRALDLLPLLAHLDEERVRAVLSHEKIGPRPVFHYRLALSHVSDPRWSILPDWERWLIVERLASDHERLGAAGRMAAG